MDSSNALTVSITDGVLAVTINRPLHRNALAISVLEKIRKTFEESSVIEEIKFATITGTGDRAFSAGGDLVELQSVRTLEAAREMAENGKRALDSIRNFPAPVIAALNGTALGGGAELCLACDMRVAASHAQIGFIQARLAIAPAWGGAVDLFDRVGYATAMRLLTRAEIIDAAEALRLGLVDRVAPEGQKLDGVLAEFVAPLSAQIPSVLRAIKQQGGATRSMRHAERLEMETRILAGLWVHPAHYSAADTALKGKR